MWIFTEFSDKEQLILVYCISENRSKKVEEKLRKYNLIKHRGMSF